MKATIFTIIVGSFIFCSLNGFAKKVEYRHDNAGRLIQVSYDSGEEILYTYDQSGNILARKVIAKLTPGSPIDEGSEPGGKDVEDSGDEVEDSGGDVEVSGDEVEDVGEKGSDTPKGISSSGGCSLIAVSN